MNRFRNFNYICTMKKFDVNDAGITVYDQNGNPGFLGFDSIVGKKTKGRGGLYVLTDKKIYIDPDGYTTDANINKRFLRTPPGNPSAPKPEAFVEGFMAKGSLLGVELVQEYLKHFIRQAKEAGDEDLGKAISLLSEKMLEDLSPPLVELIQKNNKAVDYWMNFLFESNKI